MLNLVATRDLEAGRWWALGLGTAVLLGTLAAGAPVMVLGALTLAVVVGALTRATGLAIWQMLALVALGGYVVLNYGFANFAVAGLPVGHLLMLGALGMAVLGAGRRLHEALKDPAMVLVLILVALAGLHLMFDVARHGFYAFRDASLILEGVFLLLGLLWGIDGRRTRVLLQWLFVVVLLNLAYSFTIPWALWVKDHSPVSGVFQQIPIFGYYTHSYLYLLLGALFCLGPARYVVRWPRWTLVALAGLQLFGLTLHQARSAYLTAVLAILLLALLGEARQSAALLTMIVAALLLLATLTAMNVVVQGRLAPADTEFLREHLESLSMKPGAPGVGTLEDRATWYADVWSGIQSSTGNLVLGVGFGQPLIRFTTRELVAVRQPHNTHLSVWARLGLIGLAPWIALHLLFFWRLAAGLPGRARLGPPVSQLYLWCFFFYLFSLVDTTVQPHLEFSQGAIPFYFLVGFALALTGKR